MLVAAENKAKFKTGMAFFDRQKTSTIKETGATDTINWY